MQFCRSGVEAGQADFCMAATAYHNHSSSAHDLYLSLQVRRPADSPAAGWTAVGTGPTMAGALMFVLYGDPDGTPTLSFRSVESGHSHPQALTSADMAARGVHLDVLDAKWTKSDGVYTAAVSAVCYSCTQWSGSSISATEPQTWIWAYNKDQDMQPYTYDVEMQMHMRKAGYGRFYADMAKASTHHADHGLPVPVIQSVTNIATSENPIGGESFWQKLIERPAAHAHGFLMILAFFALFPAGAVAIRSGKSKAFKYHWTVQVAAAAVALSGAATGIFMSGDVFGSTHQIVGLSICSLLLIQAVLGWRHHVNFVRVRRRTWVSYTHMGLGLLLLVGGWVNIFLGLLLYGLGRKGLIAVGVLLAVEGAMVGAWSLFARRAKAKAKAATKDGVPVRWQEEDVAYFGVGDDSDSDGESIGRVSREDVALMSRPEK